MMMNTVFIRLLQAMLLLLFQLQLQLLVSHSWSAVGCIEKERQALLDLKAGFVDDYGLLSSWGNEEEKRDCCQWERVRCSNQTGHVQMLYLQGEEDHSEVYWYDYDIVIIRRLRGKISASLMELQHLRYLNLSFNDFKYSQIPEFFGALHNLKYLDISYSSFAGKIPYQLGSLLHLKYLDLSGNSLKGTIPSQLGNLSSLQKLYLGHNQALNIQNENFADTQWLSNLTSLAELDLSEVLNLNHSHKWLQTINKLQNLRELSLVGCDLPDDDLLFLDPSKFNFSSSLTILDLSWVSNLNHSHKWLQTINKLQNLRELSLVGCDLPDDDLLLFLDPSKFNFSSSLTILDLSWVTNLNHSHYLLQIIGKLPNLRELFLRDCQLSDQDLFFLDHTKFNYSSLTTLDLSYNNIPATFLKSLANICTLRSLILSEVSLSVDFTTILHNLSGCASDTLQELDLTYNQITGLLSDVSKFPSLKSLDLQGNQLTGIAECGTHTCSLNSIFLSYNKLSAELPLVIQNLFGYRSTLQGLYLSGNQITGGLPDLSKFSSLKILYLRNNQLSGMLESSRLPPQLELLDVSSNSIEGGIPETFGKICGLRSLSLSSNSLTNKLPVIIHNLFGCARSLEKLDLSLNQITGTIPDLSKFSSLSHLDISGNQLTGELPRALRFPSQLVILNLASNSKLKGVITDSHFANMSKLQLLNLSFSSLTLSFSPSWVPSFQLQRIYLASCKLGPEFPKWLQTQKSLTSLDISDSNISDSVPEWLWSLSPRLAFLNISYNNLIGTIPTSSQSAAYVDLSRNRFSSSNMFACANITLERLRTLDVSNNHLSGQLPDCWNNFKSLVYLDMSDNKLLGTLPNSMGSLVELEALVLRHNEFNGDLPMSLMNCTKLVTLDMGENKFSGRIPFWIGNAFKQLRMLSLRINHFSGSIPSELCQLIYLQFLDLSLNNLSGEILKCLKNFTAMSQKEEMPPDIGEFILRDIYQETIYHSERTITLRDICWVFHLDVLLMWKGVERKFERNAFFLKSIDLSSNQLIGRIPEKITNLVELVSLNLSRNNLTGEIPSNIGKLNSLDALDLSRNHFWGKIPSSLAEIDRITMLDLSYNQLFGRIPTSTQLQSFNASCYDENLDLCGKPLEKKCPEKEAIQKPQKVEKIEHSIFSRPFYISMALGFVVGFWGIFISILINRSWRYLYFRFLNNLTDVVYVMLALNVAKCRVWLNVGCGSMASR